MAHFQFALRPRYILALVCLAIMLVWLAVWTQNRSGAVKAETGALPAAVEQLPLVTVVQPVEKPATPSLTLPATVEAFNQAILYAKVSGYVQWVKVDKGDHVKKGDILAALEVPEVDQQYQSALASSEQAQAEQERAQADASLKQVTYERLAAVRHSTPDVLAQQDVDAARAALDVAQGETNLAKAKVKVAQAEIGRLDAMRQFARIVAPYDGIITARFVDPGALIQQGGSSSGTPLLTIASIDTVRIYADVPEANIPHISRRMPAMVLLNAYPGQAFSGEVTRYADAVDQQTRTMKTEIDLPNPGHRILPGMYGTVELKCAAEQNAMLIPATAIRHDADGKPFVYAVDQGRIRKVPVEAAPGSEGMLAIRGLDANDTVVLSGTQPLQEGMKVRIVKAGS